MLKLEPVFTKLVDKCLSEPGSDVSWMSLNDIGEVTSRAYPVTFLIEGAATMDATDAGWQLLRHYLERYDSAATNYQYHRYVVSRIVSHKVLGSESAHMPIPPWLLRSSKVR